MSITDELRKWGRDGKGSLLAIADRIDAEHEQQMAERRRSCVFYDAERNYCKVHDEGDMAELGYVRLPVDADGEPIHQGELVEYRDHSGTWHEETTVAAITDVGCYVWAGAHLVHVWGNDCRHHHAPTVEDVLREFADEVYADADNEIRDRDFLCAKYAKRLTLAKEDA